MKNLYTFIKTHLLSNFTASVGAEQFTAYTEYESDTGVVCEYMPAGAVSRLTLTAKFAEDAVIFYLDAVCQHGFAAQNAVTWDLGDIKPDGMLGSRHDSPWWMYPSFTTDFSALLPKTQSLLLQSGALHYHLLPLCSGNFRAEFEAGKLRISSDMPGLTHLSGAVMAVSVSTDPFMAVKNNYVCARRDGAISVPLVEERTMPEIFNGFGWCTWDAFYNDVSSENIYQKLEEFKEKGIAVKWIIIDAGWQTTNERRTLMDVVANDHFPEGLAAAVKKIKEEYGVEQVGIWHTFSGYWEGIDPNSPLVQVLGDALITTASGNLLPSTDPDKACRFWDRLHGYLADCGIDFVKVDNQSSHSGHLAGTLPTAEGCRLSHIGLERSIDKYFGGVMINCMGMDMENVFARPHSAVSRNSDDFYPERERGFVKHLVQNAYNAIWHSRMYICDYDMWWSDHPESAVQSGVLRAISGSPIYVSDKIGQSRAENILPLVEDNGSIMRCDFAAQPTLDCIYTDCTAENKLLKVWNRSGDCFAVAAFHVSEAETVTDTLDFGTIPGLSDDCEYIAYEYFSKTFTRINRYEDVEITLERDGVAVWSLYPIETADDGEFILLGDTSKYVPIASRHKVRTPTSSLLTDEK